MPWLSYASLCTLVEHIALFYAYSSHWVWDSFRGLSIKNVVLYHVLINLGSKSSFACIKNISMRQASLSEARYLTLRVFTNVCDMNGGRLSWLFLWKMVTSSRLFSQERRPLCDECIIVYLDRTCQVNIDQLHLFYLPPWGFETPFLQRTEKL